MIKEQTLISKGTETNVERINMEVVLSHNSIEQVVREMVQNMLDAKATVCDIRIQPLVDSLDPNEHVVMFIDNGTGMDEEKAVKFKNIGYTTKEEGKDRGNKGVGAKCCYLPQKGTTVYTQQENGPLYKIIMRPTDIGENATTEAEVHMIENTSLFEETQIDGLENFKHGTVIIMHNLDIINLNTSVKDLKQTMLKDTHLGSFYTLPNLRGTNHMEYPLVKLEIMDEYVEFHGYKRPFSDIAVQHANYLANLKRTGVKQSSKINYDIDKISSSKELEEVIRILNETDEYKYVYDEFDYGYGKDKSKVKCYGIMGEGSFLPDLETGFKKEFLRKFWIGRDGLQVKQKFPNGFGSVNYNLYQNYMYLYADYNGIKLTNNRNEIVKDGTPKFNQMLKRFQTRIINNIVQPNNSFLNNIINKRNNNAITRKNINEAIINSKNYKEINFDVLQGLTKKKKLLNKKYATSSELTVWKALEELSEYIEVEEIDFRCHSYTWPQSKKGSLDGLVVKDEDTIETSENGVTSPDEKLLKIEIETQLGNYAKHDHILSETDYIACWTLNGWPEDMVKNINGVEATFMSDENGYFLLTEEGKNIPVIPVKELLEKYGLM